LIDFYNDVNADKKEMEVIFVPFDKNEEEFKNYYKPMPWLALPLGNDRI
jgi:nucleoredoxin